MARLQERAAAAGHSLEQEVREILAAATATDPAAMAARLRARLAAFGSRMFGDSAELVRSSRDERSA
ncbi:FitA-like ribbon-helix-helix domain-containing protein [Benzoatithermus flavus]|uniref:Antitoxin FitA-like ribbon-helix-helix domain-containing protein n=1 Tax=Benzoatithermus flavus TaxID=3108223 RepID=A0ABU8XP52_9PROT